MEQVNSEETSGEPNLNRIGYYYKENIFRSSYNIEGYQIPPSYDLPYIVDNRNNEFAYINCETNGDTTASYLIKLRTSNLKQMISYLKLSDTGGSYHGEAYLEQIDNNLYIFNMKLGGSSTGEILKINLDTFTSSVLRNVSQWTNGTMDLRGNYFHISYREKSGSKVNLEANTSTNFSFNHWNSKYTNGTCCSDDNVVFYFYSYWEDSGSGRINKKDFYMKYTNSQSETLIGSYTTADNARPYFCLHDINDSSFENMFLFCLDNSSSLTLVKKFNFNTNTLTDLNINEASSMGMLYLNYVFSDYLTNKNNEYITCNDNLQIFFNLNGIVPILTPIYKAPKLQSLIDGNKEATNNTYNLNQTFYKSNSQSTTYPANQDFTYPTDADLYIKNVSRVSGTIKLEGKTI